MYVISNYNVTRVDGNDAVIFGKRTCGMMILAVNQFITMGYFAMFNQRQSNIINYSIPGRLFERKQTRSRRSPGKHNKRKFFNCADT